MRGGAVCVATALAKGPDMFILKSIPTHAYLFAIFNFLAFGYLEPIGLGLQTVLMELVLPSGGAIFPTVSDLLLVIGVLLMYVEIVKATGTSAVSIFEHVFSTFVFIAYLIEFLLVPLAANVTFGLLMMMALLDVVAGFTVTLYTTRRNLNIGTE